MKNYQTQTSSASSDTEAALEVNITTELASVDVLEHDRMVRITRNQDQSNKIKEPLIYS